MKVRVSNIQRFSLHDGPGIRTTIFLKGCNLKCPWCANPENIDYSFTEYHNKLDNSSGIFGYDIDIDDLYKEILKDKEYYSVNNGGVTFSGGEPLLQIKNLEPLLIKLKENNINIYCETALFISKDLLDIACKYVDYFIVDMKILVKDNCLNMLNGNIEIYLNNLEYLSKLNKIDIIRIPLVKDYTFTKKNTNLILNKLKDLNFNKVEIFKIHNLAKSKYESINKELIKFNEITDDEINDLYNKIKNITNNVEIIML